MIKKRHIFNSKTFFLISHWSWVVLLIKTKYLEISIDIFKTKTNCQVKNESTTYLLMFLLRQINKYLWTLFIMKRTVWKNISRLEVDTCRVHVFCRRSAQLKNPLSGFAESLLYSSCWEAGSLLDYRMYPISPPCPGGQIQGWPRELAQLAWPLRPRFWMLSGWPHMEMT